MKPTPTASNSSLESGFVVDRRMNRIPILSEYSMTKHRKKQKKMPRPGDKVILTALPSGFVDDLPKEEQRAISMRIGRPIMLMGYDRDGRAELEFMAKDDSIHTLYVDPKFIKPW